MPPKCVLGLAGVQPSTSAWMLILASVAAAVAPHARKSRRMSDVIFSWYILFGFVYFFIGLRITEYVCRTTESTMRQMPTQKEKPTSCSSPKSTAAMAMLYSGSRL